MIAKIKDETVAVFPTDSEVKSICKIGQGADTCSWLVMSPKGWGCLYHNKPTSLIKRRELKTMTAMRDGCGVVKHFDTNVPNGTYTLLSAGETNVSTD